MKNTSYEKRNALLYAAKTGNIETLKKLLKEGVRVEGMAFLKLDTTALNAETRTEIGKLVTRFCIQDFEENAQTINEAQQDILGEVQIASCL